MRSEGRRALRWRSVWLIGITGVLLSTVFARVVQNREIRIAEAEFRLRADERILAIEHEFTAVEVVVEALAAFFDSSNDIERERFRAFTTPLLERYGSIQALGFNRRVRLAERAEHEKRFRTDEFPEYQITERTADGAVVRAADRPEYVVVQYIEPHEGNERALGFDISAEAVRREALIRSRDTGTTATTGRVSLVQADGAHFGVLVTRPVYRTGSVPQTVDERRSNLVGYAVGVHRIDETVRIALGRLEPQEIDIRLIDVGADSGRRQLHPYVDPTANLPPPLPEDLLIFQRPLPSVSANFHVGGRTWAAIATPSREYWNASVVTGPVAAAFVGGLLATALLVAYLGRQESRARELEARIAERERLEEEARRSERRYRNVVEDQADLIVRWRPSGEPTFVNQAYFQLLGISREEALRGNVLGLVHEDDLEGVKERLSLLSVKNRVSTGTHRIVLADGRVRWMLWTDRGLFDAQGELMEFQSVGHDITKQREADARQALLTSELDHRVKNTLATVLAIADETAASSTSLTSFHEALRGRLRSMARAHEVLAYNNWDGVDLSELVRQILDQTGKGPDAPVHVSAAHIQLPARAVQPVAIVLNELMTNALKHGALSVAGGEVDLECTSDDKGAIDLAWIESGGPATSPPERQGLGLSLVRDLVEQELGGSIRFEFPTTGVRCHLHISPKASPAGADPQPAGLPEPAPSSDTGAMRILVVEDDHLQSRRMVGLLTKMGCEIVGPIAQLEAALATARHADLDGAVLDVNLRGESSAPVAEVCRERRCPFVFVTGFARLDDFPESLAGAEHLTKPVASEDLEATIRKFRASRTAA